MRNEVLVSVQFSLLKPVQEDARPMAGVELFYTKGRKHFIASHKD